MIINLGILNRILFLILSIFIASCAQNKSVKESEPDINTNVVESDSSTFSDSIPNSDSLVASDIDKELDANSDFDPITDSDLDTVIVSSTKYGEKTVDTFYEKNSMTQVFLYKSAKLPSTRNQLNARGLGVEFSNFKVSDCVVDAQEGDYEPYIDSVSRTETELYVKLSVAANCAYSFLADIGEFDSTTLNLIYIAYGPTHAACVCRFELEYRIALNHWGEDNLSDAITYFVVNGKRINNLSRRQRRYMNKATKW